jgi:hypothetical protein
MTSSVIFTISLYFNLNVIVRQSNSVDLPNHHVKREKASKTFPKVFKPPHSMDWYLYLLFSHPYNYHLPDLLTSSHFRPFVLHLKIVDFWSARSNHNINIQRQNINSCHSAYVRTYHYILCIPVYLFEC